MNIPTAKRYSTLLGGRELIIETGKYAKLVAGSVTVRYGDTVVLVTAHMSDTAADTDFLPLTVEYEERHYAIGKIPGSFQRREGRPGTQATLNARITDRQIRPLFPKGLRNEVQVIITVLSADRENDPAMIAAIGASAALSISNIPWDGPTACVSVGYVDGQYVLYPSLQTLADSQLELTVAASEDAVLMVEASADELPEDTMVGAITFAQREMQGVIELIKRMRAEIGQEKLPVEPPLSPSEEDKERLYQEAVAAGLKEVLLTPSKKERSAKTKALRDALISKHVPEVANEEDARRVALLKEAFASAVQRESRRMILEEDLRADGRAPEDIRPIWIEVGVLPKTHGSAVFTRGETQVLGVTTLGTGKDDRLIDDLGLETSETFMLHYNFPPFSTGEVKRLRGVSRRELGHGNLARRALERMMPSQDTFGYVVRVVAETLESNGSSSMASVCAATLSMMDAGVPLKKPVAGIAMGLIKEGDTYKILSDILGSEDALGDMDFKVTGTHDGVTALQMDIKIKGITPEIMRAALEQARVGRRHILNLMDEVLSAPRSEVSKNAPRILTVQIPVDKIGAVIGPGGKQIRELEALGVQIDIEESGLVKIYSEEASAAEAVREQIEALTATPEVGKTYDGRVAKITEFGAFVTLFPGTDGLLHISQIAEERVHNIEDYLKVGDTLKVKIAGIDSRGKLDLVRPELEGKVPPRAGRTGSPRGGRPDGRNGGGRR
ncbi:polyribonucleotide nucleotidyltransferase [Truepera radiovictrix]|uniref:Polyribonucleotide nucleotidyltransferase n=1 Tax=Truepera radiovictrix (strain DSM 17093 / CIP 108686 / LMG 22925 / RQ-24) TaxID=649638 RepID=D7CYA2_TRURR|nr:polyribonucleotide nucleotidyltransferase [Truepera radiovictrix]ADI14741.1 polyribonucleotide nucleotidyltransferase [Truepera radiovictrix DSM 17093]WMT56709.1 polyribonucleotide nucleotidyltransferase [Truepera radiovictrix]